jgi:hypothetical protein
MRIFEPKRDEVTGGWKKLHNEELHNLFYSTSINRIVKLRGDEMSRACRASGTKKNAYSILMGKPKRKRPLGRPSRR